MRLDKQKFNFNLTSTGENIIRCSQVDEAFFNVFNIVLNEDVAFIKPAERYIDGHPIIKIDVEYGNKLYENIEFKVVADASAKSQVFINEHALLHGETIEFESESLLQEQIVQVEELIEEPIELEPTQDWHNLEEQARANKESKIATFLLQMEQQLLERIDESIAQARQSIATSALGIQNKAESTIQQKVKESSSEFARLFEQWKQSTEIKINGHTIDVLKKACKHLEDQFEVVVQEQEESTFSHLSEKIFAASIETKNALHGEITSKVKELTESLQITIKDADESLRLHVEQQLQQFNDNIVAESIKNFDDGIAAFFNKQTLWLQEASTKQITQISESADARIDAACKTIDEAIENLQGKHGELAQQLKEHAQQTLEQAADKITTEQIKSVRECVDEVLAEQMHALEAKASDEQIISEARAAQANVFKNALGAIKTEMSNEVKSHVANLQSDLYKKFAIYAQSYAGGGTVAAQFADGGTMNGTLNVATGQILSAGIDLFDIFAGGSGPSGEPLFTSWSQTYSANYESTYSTVFANSASWGAGGAAQTLSFNESTAQLTISDGNTISLSALSGGTAGVSYLSALNDVSIPAPVNGQVLTYNSITKKWNAGTPLSASGATGYYGSFYDTTAQTLTSTTQAKRIDIAQTYEHNGVSIDNNRIVFNYSGVYELIYSIQYKNTDASQQDIYIWFKQNGADIPNSSSIFTIPARKNDNIPAQLIAVTPFMLTLTAGDFIELYWHCSNTAVSIETFTTHSNPTIPDTPGVIVTVKQVTNVQIVPTVGAYLPLSGGTLTGAVSTNQDIEITDSTKGIILRSPGNVKYRVTVTDAGELVTTLV